MPRSWVESADVENLDFSGAVNPGSSATIGENVDPTQANAQASRMDVMEEIDYEEDDLALEGALRSGSSAPPKGVLANLLSSVHTSVMGKEALSADDVRQAVDAMRKRLQQRNVSAEVAGKVCASVAATLEGKRLASFTGVASLVRNSMEQSITRILSPKKRTDVLADIRANKARGRPYSIVFVGVNGVGKSTNLAKIAYWLRQQDLRVMIAACDTFRYVWNALGPKYDARSIVIFFGGSLIMPCFGRSGAVEQLKTHCNRLGVPLYDRGYDRDPTNVAAEALRQAQRDGVDVVLIDTAGRMQDNEPLMQALSMLINKNNPDLVLFVGEALVGNDGA
jgi:signal recognition particle receptor subunit alpha